nr:ORF1 [Torque teno felis virus]
MAPYRRRRRWYRPRRRWRRRKYPYRRIWRPRRQRKYRRRVGVFKRRKKLATFWDPINKAKCTISGLDFGLITRSGDTVQRMFKTEFKPTVTTKHLEGGGVSLRIFDLHYLYHQHRMFKNKWTHTNDGFDVAQYLGTTIYLQPNPVFDYLFFWDTDLLREQPYDIIRMHPMTQLNSKNVVWVRNQLTSKNTRTKKIKIKPPATLLNTWKLQNQWVDIPLFMYGFCLVNWKEPLYRQGDRPIPVTEINCIKFETPGGTGIQNQKVGYSYIVDTGVNNRIGVKFLAAGIPAVDQSKVQWVSWADDLPYWLTLFGQDHDMTFNQTNETPETNTQTWIFFRWPTWTQDAIQKGKPSGQTYYTWAATSQEMLKIPRMGPLIVSSLDTIGRVNVPFIYKSHWKWGGTQLVQQPITAITPAPNQVSVKDPGTQLRSLIYPWDLSGGTLTEDALRRFLEPRQLSDERRPLPIEEPTTGYAYPASSGEETSETEESEDESNEISQEEKTTRTIRKLVQRERDQRHKFKHLLRSLVTHKTHTV